MGLMNARNLKKAKSMLEKNRHKVGDLVGKATDQVDKVSKGKTSNLTAKIDEAARKFSGDTASGEAVADDAEAGADDEGSDSEDTTPDPAG
jgi:uncharacterized protein YjbJ (UPF0337 family)